MDTSPYDGMKKYEALAQETQEYIAAGTLVAGDRLPSVREMVKSRGVSPSTVFEAYYLLEARGVIEARARSGYFVKGRRAIPEEPRLHAPPLESTAVAISDLVIEVLGSVRERTVVPMGSAFPNPDLFPLERLARAGAAAMKRLNPKEILENLSPGNEALRRQVALRYVANGTLVSTNEVVLTSGAMEALNLCLQAVTKPGDVVAVESPTFYGCLQALERLQLKAVEVATHPSQGVQIEALEEVLRRHPVKACWFMPNFQNPTGSLMPAEKKKALVELLAKHEVPLIEDDVYAELYFGMARPVPAKSFDRKGMVMHCGSFSKCLAPGYRVGWTAAGRFTRDVERMKLMSTLAIAVPSQVAIREYLQHGAYDKHLRALRRTLAQRQQSATDLIRRHLPPETRVTQPAGGYFLWVELPPAVDALQLHRVALSQRISIAPGHLFSTSSHFKHYVRLNFGHPEPVQLAKAIQTLGQMVKGLLEAA
jgi:DNA-binding transcriptional MocR family regulator